MKISKFPLFSLVLLGGAVIYAIVFCKFLLLDNTCKMFIQETMTTFLNDFEQAKSYKAQEITDESLEQLHAFRANFGQCKLKDISILKGFKINSSGILKVYMVTIDCEKKKSIPMMVLCVKKAIAQNMLGLLLDKKGA